MLIFDNIINIKPEHGVSPGNSAFDFSELADGETVGELCARLAVGDDRVEKVINGIGELIRAGAVEIQWKSRSGKLERAIEGGEAARRLCGVHPYLWNVLTYEMEWKIFPEYNDFLDPGSPVHEKKKFQWSIYAELLAEKIGELPLGARVLDIGGGVGREAVPLAARGCDVTLVDASPRALSAAWKHLSAAGAGSYDLAWGDAGDLAFLPDYSFDAVLALEVFCYHGNPKRALAEAVRKVTPGGWIAFSVENKAGAMMADPSLKRKDILRMVNNKRILIEEDLYVEYFGRKELETMAESAGIRDVRVTGCHFIADGVFGKFLREEHFMLDGIKKRILASEQFLRTFPTTRNIGRAWLVSGYVD